MIPAQRGVLGQALDLIALRGDGLGGMMEVKPDDIRPSYGRRGWVTMLPKAGLPYLNADYAATSVPVPKGVGPVNGKILLTQQV